MTIQIATSNDIPDLTRLASLFRDMLQRQTPTDAEFQKGIETLFNSPDAEFILAKDAASNACGYILQRFYYSMWHPGFESRIEDLYVIPESRGSGIGKKLVEFAIDRAREKQCLSIYLDTNENNEAANSVYQSLGFICKSNRWKGGKQIFYRLSLT
ncbi:GNAT family N-acetyltransferase [bacterium]